MGGPNRVPEVTVAFWVIKLLVATVGEAVVQYLAVSLELGLAGTMLIMVGLLAIALALQFARKAYVPVYYWLAVLVISIAGTLLSDNLRDTFEIRLLTTTIAFSLILVVIFALWFGCEKTLSIRSIVTNRREVFYWLAVLFTFALGTSVDDWLSDSLGLGYFETGVIFLAVTGLIALGYYAMQLHVLLAFWLAYIFTRPLGASIGDLLAQPAAYGGFGFGIVATGLLFLGGITALVAFMTINRNRGVVIAGE
jgi:uncharacterized membrane-anchored protein